jgi:hypothetical protein
MSLKNKDWRERQRSATFPTAPLAPKMPIARACSCGSGKMMTRSVSADGMVSAGTADAQGGAARKHERGTCKEGTDSSP